MEYTVDYFIQKFEAIPEEKWTTGRFIDEEGRCCAAGHCGERETGRSPIEARRLCDLFDRIELYIARVNDGDVAQYQQPTPKQRVLAALNDIKTLANAPQIFHRHADDTRPQVDHISYQTNQREVIHPHD